eukprot:Ihof_evm2s399 gene=Ihof_evmTU2s399
MSESTEMSTNKVAPSTPSTTPKIGNKKASAKKSSGKKTVSKETVAKEVVVAIPTTPNYSTSDKKSAGKIVKTAEKVATLTPTKKSGKKEGDAGEETVTMKTSVTKKMKTPNGTPKVATKGKKTPVKGETVQKEKKEGEGEGEKEEASVNNTMEKKKKVKKTSKKDTPEEEASTKKTPRSEKLTDPGQVLVTDPKYQAMKAAQDLIEAKIKATENLLKATRPEAPSGPIYKVGSIAGALVGKKKSNDAVSSLFSVTTVAPVAPVLPAKFTLRKPENMPKFKTKKEDPVDSDEPVSEEEEEAVDMDVIGASDVVSDDAVVPVETSQGTKRSKDIEVEKIAKKAKKNEGKKEEVLKGKEKEIEQKETEIVEEVKEEKKVAQEIGQEGKRKKKEIEKEEEPKTKKAKKEKKVVEKVSEKEETPSETSPEIPLEQSEQSDAVVANENTAEDTVVEDVRGDRTIFVGNLNTAVATSKTKIAKLQKFFETYGPVESIRFRSVAFAKTKMPRMAAMAKKEFHEGRSSLNAYIVFKETAGAQAALAANGTLWEDKHIRVDMADNKAHDTKYTVFVGSLPFNIEDEAVFAKFSECGKVKAVRVVRDKRMNVGKGIAYVTMADKAGMGMAMRLNFTQFEGRSIR